MKMLNRKDGPDHRLRNIGDKLNRYLRRNADGLDPAPGRPSEKRGLHGSAGPSIKDRLPGLGKSRAEKPVHNPSMGTNRSAKMRRENRVSWMFLTPSLIGVGLFFVLPFIVVIYYSMIDNPIRHRFVGLANYGRVFKNEAFRVAVANTLKFSIVAVPLAVGLSLLLAVIMEQKLPWKNWLKSAYAQVPIVLLFLWKNLGYNMILFMSGLANIPRDQLEVARLESASEFQIFWLIKIRYLSSTIMFVTIMSLINSFKVFREVYLMAGDYPYDALYMLQHFMNNTFKSLDYQKLSAAAVLMAIFMVIVIGSLFLTEDWFGRDLE